MPGDVAQGIEEDVHQRCQGGLCGGDRVQSRLSQFAMGGAGDVGQDQAGDEGHADTGSDECRGDGVRGGPVPDARGETGLGGVPVELLAAG